MDMNLKLIEEKDAKLKILQRPPRPTYEEYQSKSHEDSI
jgi:hypothetical protein